MNTQNALEIVSSLAEGIDPHTGEIFDSESVYQAPETIRALFKAKEALERLLTYENRQKTLPQNAGMPWTMEEEQQLIAAFDQGKAIKDLGNLHKRTEGAISSRLVKLGKIER